MRTKNNNMDDHEAVISVRLTREQHEKLKALATRQSRTVSQQVRYLVAEATAEPAHAA